MRFPSFSPRRINQKNQKERHNFLLEKRKKSEKKEKRERRED
jgi:hypothetical protein